MHRLAEEYSDVQYEDVLVDNAAMQLVKDPSQFDVVVTENMFGDILSDEASMITGSIGLLPSVAMMFRYSFHLADEAAAIEKAVDAVLAQGWRTPDIAKAGETAIGTQEMGRRIREAL